MFPELTVLLDDIRYIPRKEPGKPALQSVAQTVQQL
jgi:hypothetical protein